MFYLKKTLNIAMAHKLDLDYDSPCKNLHGHNLKVTIYCKSPNVNSNGMIIDFKEIKNIVHGSFDHRYLNELSYFYDNYPTAENIAFWICNNIPNCYKVTVEESPNNEVTYERD